MTRFFLDVVVTDGSSSARLAFQKALDDHGYKHQFADDDGRRVVLPPGRCTLSSPSSAAFIRHLVEGYARAAGCRVDVLISSDAVVARAA